MEELLAAQTSMQENVPFVVARHRKSGVLTWRLLHLIETEVLAEVAATGRHPKWVLDILRAPVALAYPKDEQAVSFDGHDFIPPVFAAIDDAWRRANQQRKRT